MSLVELVGVRHRFGSRAVLDGVDLQADLGEVVALIGPNGAGKSTLLSVAAGDLRPEEGTVVVAGRHPGRAPALEIARLRSVLLQHAQVSFSYRVADVVAMGRTPWKNTDQAGRDEDAVDAALDTTETRHLAQRDVTTLSGGEAGRTQLARVLAQETPVVLLDEPTAALDIRHQESTLGTCRALAEQGAAVVVVLHDIDVAAAYADRIVLLRDGAVVAQGRPEEVCTAERLSEVYGWPIEVFAHPETGRLLVRPRR